MGVAFDITEKTILTGLRVNPFRPLRGFSIYWTYINVLVRVFAFLLEYSRHD